MESAWPTPIPITSMSEPTYPNNSLDSIKKPPFSREAEQSRSNRNLKIADIKEQGKRDLTSAQDKLQSDRDHFLTADTLTLISFASCEGGRRILA